MKQWGTWKAGVSLLNTGIRHPGSVMKNVIPIVMAGVIGIYGLIIAVILGGNIPSPTVGTGENIYSIYTGMAHVSWGLFCHEAPCSFGVILTYTIAYYSTLSNYSFALDSAADFPV